MMAKISTKKSKVSHKKRSAHKKKVSGIIKPQIASPQLINPPCNFDETLNLPPSGHVTMYGVKDIPGASRLNYPPAISYQVTGHIGANQ